MVIINVEKLLHSNELSVLENAKIGEEELQIRLLRLKKSQVRKLNYYNMKVYWLNYQLTPPAA